MYFSLFLGPGVRGPHEDRLAITLGIDQAVQADDAGFAAVYVGEQHFNNYEPYADGLGMAAFLAGRLRNAYLGTSMVPLFLHHPLIVAERANLLDQLTDGKFILGVSSGRPRDGKAWNKQDLTSEQRTALFDQKLDVMLRAWAHRAEDGPLEFSTDDGPGVMEGRMMPVSYRAPHPLYAIGTNTPAKIAEAGRRGQKVHLGQFDLAGGGRIAELYRTSMRDAGHPDGLVEGNLRWLIHTKIILVADTDAAAWELAHNLYAGPMLIGPWVRRDPAQAGWSLREIYDAEPGDFAPAMGSPESLTAYLRRTTIVGSPDSVARELATYQAAGLSHIHARFIFGTLDDPGIFQRSFSLFTKEVMPSVGVDTIPAPTG